jgi:antitoxin component of RelBE/YafQ-DinJ toxin-antitoxin module
MNITLSIDERLAERARRVATAMGKSLNQLIREHLQAITTRGDAEAFSLELRRLSASAKGHAMGRRLTREDAHDRT